MIVQSKKTLAEYLRENPALGKKKLQHTKPLTPGVYRTPDRTVYVVRQSRAEDKHCYALRFVDLGRNTRLTESGDIVHFDFEYTPGAMSQIQGSDKLSPQQASELAVKYGHCLLCGKKLKVAKSVLQMMGPVCIKKQSEQ